MFLDLNSRKPKTPNDPVRRDSGLATQLLSVVNMTLAGDMLSLVCPICATEYHIDLFVASMKYGVAFKIFACYVLSMKCGVHI